eukprot:113481-Chlamydomonas_euryale.AAC.3
MPRQAAAAAREGGGGFDKLFVARALLATLGDRSGSRTYFSGTPPRRRGTTPPLSPLLPLLRGLLSALKRDARLARDRSEVSWGPLDLRACSTAYAPLRGSGARPHRRANARAKFGRPPCRKPANATLQSRENMHGTPSATAARGAPRRPCAELDTQRKA